MLTLQIKEKEIENLTPEEEFVRGTVGAKCQINFDEFWQGYEKYIVFKRVGYEPINIMVNSLENEIEIPYTILAESGEFKIGVFGTTETETLPTLYSKDIKILYGTDTHGTTPPTYIPSEIDQLRLSKQDRLVSGENIKTVNGESVLGSGNIKIQVEVDQTYDPDSTNAQSGTAVDEALSGYVMAEVGKGLSSNDFTNEDKEKLYSALQNENIDKTYNPTSENAQSGLAVAQAVSAEQNRANNTFSNALKGSKSGSAILIDDISPVTHNMGVKISSNTVTDLTVVKVSRYGKNLFDKTSVLDTNNWVNYQSGYRNYHITGLKPNTKYTFSMSANNWVGVSNNSFYMSINTVQSVYSAYPIVHSNGVAYFNPKKQTITSSNNGDLYLQFYNVTTERLATCFNGLIDLQLEIGSERTNYEPYKTPTEYTPTADGTVNGVKSLYPNTTLMTDTDGVIIDCEYNRDINELVKSDSFVSIPITFDINKGFYISPLKKWVNSSSLFDTSNPIPVIGGITLKYKHTFANKYIAQIAFALTADRTDEAIMSVIVTEDSEDIITTVPEGANYAYVCIQNNQDTINSISLSYDSSDIGLNIVNKFSELNDRFKSLSISLPEKYDLVVGDTFELFWKGIILANDINQYNIKVTCSIGNCFKNKYMVTPAAVGNYSLKISVYNDGGELLKSAETSLVVSETATSPANIKNILCVGDSLLSNGQWAYEACRRFTATNGSPTGLGLSNISFIGSRMFNNVGYEGYGGWTFDSYNTANVLSSYVWITTVHTKTEDDQHSLYRDANGAIWKIETIETGKLKMIRTSGNSDMPSSGTLTYVSGGTDTSNIVFTASELAAGNPFWNETANAVDFTAYAAKFEASTIDYCYILLGWNMSTKTEEEIKASARTFIDNLLADFPDCKITLLGLEIPSLDGCGVNYGCSWNWFEKARYVFDLNDWYAEIAEEYDNVNFVNVAGQFDTENNMITGTRQVNVRNTKTETYQTNGVHPDTSGYNQIADAVFRHLNSIL